MGRGRALEQLATADFSGAYNEILAARYNKLLQKLLSIKADPPAPTLAGEIFPVLELESRPEYQYLMGVNLCGFGGTVAASGAANTSGFRFRLGFSSIMAVFERLIVSAPVATGVYIARGNATVNLTNVAVAGTRDSRLLTVRPAVIVSSQTTAVAAVGDDVARLNLSANASIELNLDLVLRGPANIDITGDNDRALIITAMWRERAIEDAEG